jgi:hypothetical protein
VIIFNSYALMGQSEVIAFKATGRMDVLIHSFLNPAADICALAFKSRGRFLMTGRAH